MQANHFCTCRPQAGEEREEGLHRQEKTSRGNTNLDGWGEGGASWVYEHISVKMHGIVYFKWM